MDLRNQGEKNPMYGKHHTEETKEKIRQARLGTKMPPKSKEYRETMSKLHKGKVVSEETRRKISEAKMGKPSPRKGSTHTEESKQKIREARALQVITEETRKKISEAGKGRIPWNKGKRYKRKKSQFFGDQNPNWRGGISFELYSKEFSKELKEAIRKRDNYTCQECGVRQDEMCSYLKKLDVHHIDYDKRNNDPINLISLCRGCHAKTSFTREDWVRYFSKRMQS